MSLYTKSDAYKPSPKKRTSIGKGLRKRGSLKFRGQKKYKGQGK